jgi:hypothetical protein
MFHIPHNMETRDCCIMYFCEASATTPVCVRFFKRNMLLLATDILQINLNLSLTWGEDNLIDL